MLNQAANYFRSYDKFGLKPAYKVNFEGAHSSYVSYMGTLCTMIFFAISTIFLYSKIVVLI